MLVCARKATITGCEITTNQRDCSHGHNMTSILPVLPILQTTMLYETAAILTFMKLARAREATEPAAMQQHINGTAATDTTKTTNNVRD